MTKEELKQEAEEKSIEYGDSIESISIYPDVLHYSWEQLTNAYIQGALDFAEPREKRITELEATNKNISNECHKLVDSLEKKQNEVAELKERNRDLLESCEGATMMYKDLCKAKELIRTLLLVADNKISQMEFQLCVADAKQFLEESK